MHTCTAQMPAGKIVGGVFLSRNQLLWVEELAVGAGAHLVNHRRFLSISNDDADDDDDDDVDDDDDDGDDDLLYFCPNLTSSSISRVLLLARPLPIRIAGVRPVKQII